jgi:hypothetical protein
VGYAQPEVPAKRRGGAAGATDVAGEEVLVTRGTMKG